MSLRHIALLLSVAALASSGCKAQTDSTRLKRPFFKRAVQNMYKFVKEFSKVDTNYIEPQHYNYTFMLQNTNSYERYRIRSQRGNDFSFSPSLTSKVGPYIGWRWIFLGYTLDFKHLKGNNNKKEFDLSLYSSQIGIDLFYRKSGADYRIKELSLGDDIDTRIIRNLRYDGLRVGIKGFNLYYIFNHRKFSYPAAFSQSTVQRKSCGSPLVGLGYSHHTLSVDWNTLYTLVANELGEDIAKERMDSSLTFGKIRYTDYSLSGGYAYNWVFAHNWLFAASLSLAVGYKQATSDTKHKGFSLRDFSMKNLNIDGVGRFGIVWNNTKWYCGASVIIHSYNYKKKQFSTSNFFGNTNVYAGFNFGRQGKKKKDKSH